MPIAVLTLAFDPVVQIAGGVAVRAETLVLAIVLLAGLLIAARIGRLTPAVGPYVPAPGLRPDDLLYIVVGTVPGVVAGARLGYVLDHLDFYANRPNAIIDLGQGGFGLTLAVPLGILTGAFIARLIGAPVARWAHAMAFPLLFVLLAGKLAGVLGATGQGLPSDLPWATAYEGPGPWGSLGAAVPSHPAQVYEALLVLLALGGLAAAQRLEVVARRDGAALWVAVGLWAVARFAVAFTWRDPSAVGPLRADQLQALLVAAVALVGLVERARAPLQAIVVDEAEPEPEPA